jgi:hypothetical protein
VDRAEPLTATLAAIHGPNLPSRMFINVYFSLGAERLLPGMPIVSRPDVLVFQTEPLAETGNLK